MLVGEDEVVALGGVIGLEDTVGRCGHGFAPCSGDGGWDALGASK
jgi:hypothetical protein